MKTKIKSILWVIFSLVFIVGLYLTFNFLRITYLTQPIDKDPPWLLNCNPEATLCEVYLSSTIHNESKYLQIYSLIENSPETMTISIHLSGYGGEMSAVYYFYNAISASKAKVNTIIEGPVYSAHALIGMFGNKITIRPASFVMFHKPAVLNNKSGEYIDSSLACNFLYGQKDRGQDLVKKCIDNNSQALLIVNKIFNDKVRKYMNTKEIEAVENGFDVYLSANELQRRLSNYEHSRNRTISSQSTTGH